MLYLNDDKTTKFPLWTTHLSQTEEIRFLGGNGYTLPTEFKKFINLKSLTLMNNNFSIIPEVIKHCTQLEELHIGSCKLSEIPIWLSNLPLISLDLSSNNITNLPLEFSQLKKLQELDFYANPIKDIPNWINQLTSLKSLDIRYTNLETLPKEMLEFPSLSTLKIGDTAVKKTYRLQSVIQNNSMLIKNNIEKIFGIKRAIKDNPFF